MRINGVGFFLVIVSCVTVRICRGSESNLPDSSCRIPLINAVEGPEVAAIRSSFQPDNFYWTYPSDHLPVMGRVEVNTTKETFGILTWNVLNSNYLKHIINGTQGLQSSSITEEADRLGRIINEMDKIHRLERPGVYALQEVEPGLLEKLRAWADANHLQIRIAENPSLSPAGQVIDFGVVIFDPKILNEQPEGNFTLHFEGPTKYMQSILFSTSSGARLQIVNVHKSFTDHSTLENWLLRPAQQPQIVLGDLNLNLEQARKLLNHAPGFSLMSKPDGDFSHVNHDRELSDYDHILFAGQVHVSSMTRPRVPPFRTRK